MAPRTALQAIGIERSEAMARYIWDSHACALAGDNPGIEVWPGDPSAAWPFAFLHHVLIGQFGLALGELWELGALAADCAQDNVYDVLHRSAAQRRGAGSARPPTRWRSSNVNVPAYDRLPKTAKGNVGSAWGLFGADDSLGLMNLQTPERIAAGARLVKRGAVFALNAPLDAIIPPMFGRGTPRHTIFRTPSDGVDDVLDNIYPQASSQWDSLAHASFERGIFYNRRTYDDVRAGRTRSTTGRGAGSPAARCCSTCSASTPSAAHPTVQAIRSRSRSTIWKRHASSPRSSLPRAT